MAQPSYIPCQPSKIARSWLSGSQPELPCSVLRKGLLTKAFRQMSIDKDREVKLSQLLLSINAVLAEMQARAPFMHPDTGEMVYHGSEQQVCWGI